MQIQGPFKINIMENGSSQGKELHLTFTDNFQHLDHVNRVAEFNEHINTLRQQIKNTDDETAGIIPAGFLSAYLFRVSIEMNS